MKKTLLLALVPALLASGCTAQRPRAYTVLPLNDGDGGLVKRAEKTLATLYPPEYRATQRVVITVGKRQFVCDGVMTASPEMGNHLAVISTLGLVTELQVDTNRASEVLRSTPLFREDWSKSYIARDVKRLFMPREDANIAGRLKDGRPVLETKPTPEGYLIRYILSPDAQRLDEVEVEHQGTRVYHALVRRYRKFEAFPESVPSEIEVVAPAYKLNLRTAAMSLPAAGGAE